ncbi:hypothetical protein SeLEV6574_g05062 [Synchytrium endobioticum]|nr:hypothetical protein SeLEV6574_g05062 [Synchytrium endobioticum]
MKSLNITTMLLVAKVISMAASYAVAYKSEPLKEVYYQINHDGANHRAASYHYGFDDVPDQEEDDDNAPKVIYVNQKICPMKYSIVVEKEPCLCVEEHEKSHIDEKNVYVEEKPKFLSHGSSGIY